LPDDIQIWNFSADLKKIPDVTFHLNPFGGRVADKYGQLNVQTGRQTDKDGLIVQNYFSPKEHFRAI